MIARVAAEAKYAAAHSAQTAVLGLGAMVMLAVGIGFLTAAAWIYLASVTTALNTALIIGFFYIGLALILLAVTSARARASRRAFERAKLAATAPITAGTIGLPALIMAFISGVTAGSKARN